MNEQAEALTQELGLPVEEKYRVLGAVHRQAQRMRDLGEKQPGTLEYVTDQLGRIVQIVVSLLIPHGPSLGQSALATRGALPGDEQLADPSSGGNESQIIWKLPAIQSQLSATATSGGGVSVVLGPMENGPHEAGAAGRYAAWSITFAIDGLPYGPKITSTDGSVEFDELAFDADTLRRAEVTITPAEPLESHGS